MKRSSLFLAAATIIAVIGSIAIYYFLTAATIKVERFLLSTETGFGNSFGVTEKDLNGLPSLKHAIELADKNYYQYLEDRGNQAKADGDDGRIAPPAEVRASVFEGMQIIQRFQIHEGSSSILRFDDEYRAYVVRVNFGW